MTFLYNLTFSRKNLPPVVLPHHDQSKPYPSSSSSSSSSKVRHIRGALAIELYSQQLISSATASSRPVQESQTSSSFSERRRIHRTQASQQLTIPPTLKETPREVHTSLIECIQDARADASGLVDSGFNPMDDGSIASDIEGEFLVLRELSSQVPMHEQVEIEELDLSDWDIVRNSFEEDGRGSYLRQFSYATSLKQFVQEHRLQIEILDTRLVYFPAPDEERFSPDQIEIKKWGIIKKKHPPLAADETLRALARLSPEMQTKLAQDLCYFIIQTGYSHVRPESIRIENGKIVLQDFRANDQTGKPFRKHSAIAALRMMTKAFKGNSIFHHTAMNALNLLKDEGIEHEEQIRKLDRFHTLLMDVNTPKSTLLTMFYSLDPRVQEVCHFLVWVAKRKPKLPKGQEGSFIPKDPKILAEIQDLEGRTLIQQVREFVDLNRQCVVTQRLLFKFKEALSRNPPNAQEIFSLIQHLKEQCSRDYVFLPLFNKMEEILEKNGVEQGARRITPEQLMAFCAEFLSLSTPGSRVSLLDELIGAWQSVREDLTINALKFRLRNLETDSSPRLPKIPTDKKSVTADRFPSVIPSSSRLQQKMQVWVLSYEIAGYGLSLGGLGPAVRGQVQALRDLGYQVNVISPKFDILPPHLQEKLGEEGIYTHLYRGREKSDRAFVVEQDGIHFYYLEDTNPMEGRDHYRLERSNNIYRDGILATEEPWYGLKERMLYFSSAAAALIKTHRHAVDLLFLNDWHVGDTIRHLRNEGYRIPTVFVIHNNSYGCQGVFENRSKSAEIPGFFGGSDRGANILLESIEGADHVITVSNNFATEMQREVFGSGISPWIRKLAADGKFTGITSGSNPDLWNPENDKNLKEWKELRRNADGTVTPTGNIIDLSYSSRTPHLFAAKTRIREQLQLAIELYYPEEFQRFGIQLMNRPLVMFVGRYDSTQKGIDKFHVILEEIQRVGGYFISLGVSEDERATVLLDALEAQAEQNKSGWITRGDEEDSSKKMQMGHAGKPPLGSLIRNAADYLVVPSCFEPCGLVQFEAWLVAVFVLLATETGGLADTIFDPRRVGPEGFINGFLFPRLLDWASDEQNELIRQTVRDAISYWETLSVEKKEAITRRFMERAQQTGWMRAPEGVMTPAEGYQRIIGPTIQHSKLRRAHYFDARSIHQTPRLTMKLDEYFGEGIQSDLYKEFGAHLVENGVRFKVLAPNASAMYVKIAILDGERVIPMARKGEGIWEVTVEGIGEGDVYEYAIETPDGRLLHKADPFAFSSEKRPLYGSVVADPHSFEWTDEEWIRTRAERFEEGQYPLNVYEVHIPSWKKTPEGEFPNYRELAHELAQHCKEMHFTHIELLGLLEHPLDSSWGYQVTGYFSPTSRHGTVQDFQYFVNHMHENGIAVALDWIPYHFAVNNWSMGQFDGSPLLESADPINGVAPDGWGTYVMDTNKRDTRNFLLSSAVYWIQEMHIDVLRVDAASHWFSLERSKNDYRPEIPGSTDNPSGMEMTRELNTLIHRDFPGVKTHAENWECDQPDTIPIESGGFGYDRRWSTTCYGMIHRLPKAEDREHLHHWVEEFGKYFDHKEIISLSHDESKRSLYNRASGTEGEKFAYVRMFNAAQVFLPGYGVLRFMGLEFGQKSNWDVNREVEIVRMREPGHRGVYKVTRKVNKLYERCSFLWTAESFEWINRTDSGNNVVSYQRGNFIVVHNFSKKSFHDYRLHFLESNPPKGFSTRVVELLNTDDLKFEGSGAYMNRGEVEIQPDPHHPRPFMEISLPGQSTVVFETLHADSEAAANDS